MTNRLWRKYKIVEIEGRSMYPNLRPGWFVLFKKQKLIDLIRGDIVLYQYNDKVLIKRIIGLPEEYIEIKGSKLYINDTIVEEIYLDTPRSTDSISQWQSSENEFVLLGDNSSDSLDSRKLGLLILPDAIYKFNRILWPIRRNWQL